MDGNVFGANRSKQIKKKKIKINEGEKNKNKLQ